MNDEYFFASESGVAFVGLFEIFNHVQRCSSRTDTLVIGVGNDNIICFFRKMTVFDTIVNLSSESGRLIFIRRSDKDIIPDGDSVVFQRGLEIFVIFTIAFAKEKTVIIFVGNNNLSLIFSVYLLS